MSALLEITGLNKRYGSTTALSNINLRIEKAAAIGLVGKNGAGKTTLLSILSGALRANTGSISILGETPESIATTGKLNVLPQDATFKKGIPVYKQLIFFARLQGMSKMEANASVEKLLNKLRDSQFVQQVPETISYGQRKRLAILQAFLGNPELVILDEPTAGLDPIVANDVRQLIRKLSTQTAFIISSHNLYEIENICSSVIILDTGKLIASKQISQLGGNKNKLNLTLDHEADEKLLQALLAIPKINNLAQDSLNHEKIILDLGTTNPGELQMQVQKLIMAHGYAIIELSHGKSLVDGFMDLIDPK